MSSKPAPPEARDEKQPSGPVSGEEPGTNAVEHEPDPKAKPLPDGQHKHVPRSPYTTGND
jgi:hypothetical protein